MHKLKYLEITNFKSYKETYRIPFTSHFTCIIGPNGSGKSNILDAIVFCTSNKPYNVRNCTVKLVISNNSEEIIFTRYINNSGKSSYFHNNKKVLYKEYINNFIIYQTHTDLNISEILDDICGSSVYKDEYERLNKEYSEMLAKLKIESEARKQYLNVLKENKKYEEEVKKNLELGETKKKLEIEIFDCKIKSLFVKYNKLNKINYKKILEIRDLKKQNEIIKNKKNLIYGFMSEIQDKIEHKSEIIKKLDFDLQSLEEIKKPIEGFDELEKEYFRVLNGDINISDDGVSIDPILDNLVKSKEDLELRNQSKMIEYERILNEEVEYTRLLNIINNEILVNKNIKVKSIKMYNLKSKLKKIKGVIGFIPDLIKCNNDKYDIPVRSLLSKYESTVVVEDEECAVECIKYCKINRLGRISCVCSSSIDRFIRINKKKGEGIVDNINKNMLVDPILVIDYPDDIRFVIEYIFSNIYITDSSYSNYKDINNNYDICTIDGILIKNKGRLIKYNSTVYEKVDDLVIRRMDILDKLDNIRKNKDRYTNIELIQDRIKKIERDIENRKMSFTKKEISPSVVENKVFKDIFIKNGYINYNDYVTRNSKYYKEEKNLRKKVLLDKKKKLEREIINYNLELNKLKEEDDKLIISEVEDIEDYPVYDIEGEKERILEEIKDLYFIERNIVIEEKDIINNDLNNQNILKEKDQSESEINMIRHLDYDSHLIKLERDLKNVNSLLSSSSLLIKNTLKIDFNSDLYDTLKNKTYEIKGLLNTVRNKRNTLFMECIKNINDSISVLYSRILDGSCNLVVENKEDPFSGSIKYYVMVPNKKFKEYSYLSGGEQMISRIIFMYGVYHYRRSIKETEKIIPSFILLDEVDSNLDNQNVNRLVQFIKNEDIQVVMVSLKVGVYKECDSMIGVYKREGKSNLLYYSY